MRTDTTTGLHTIVFVEREKDKGKMVVGYHLDPISILRAPPGRIRIARFTNSFNPKKNFGYYGESYLHIAIRQWKTKKQKERMQLFRLIAQRKNMYYDVAKYILEYL